MTPAAQKLIDQVAAVECGLAEPRKLTKPRVFSQYHKQYVLKYNQQRRAIFAAKGLTTNGTPRKYKSHLKDKRLEGMTGETRHREYCKLYQRGEL